MAKKPELTIPVSASYVSSLLRPQIEALGRNRIAKLAHLDPSTVHRNINEPNNLTYTTAMGLVDAIRQAHAEDRTQQPALPPPLAPVVSADHYAWCLLGERLAAFPDVLAKALATALDSLHEAERDKLLGDVQARIKNPK